MHPSVTQLHGWGYEGRSLDGLIAHAQQIEIGVVVDVRLNPISRKRGLSKRGLSERLETAGVKYLHLPALGNPRDNRAGFSEPRGPVGRAAHERFRREVLETDGATLAIDQIVSQLAAGPVLLLCYEAEQACCHRHLVMDAVTEALELASA